MDKFYSPKIDIMRLQAQLKAAGLPITNVRIAKDLTIDYDWLEVPTEAQFQLAAEILAAHDPADVKTEPDIRIEDKLDALIGKLEEDAMISAFDLITTRK